MDVSSRDILAGSSHKRPHIGSSNPVGIFFDVQGREVVDAAIVCFFYTNGIPFNVAHSPIYGEMVQAITNLHQLGINHICMKSFTLL